MLDHLRQVIGLRGYGQRDPLNEYKAEAFSLFEAMSQNLREAVTAQLMRVEIMARRRRTSSRRRCRRWKRTRSIRRPARTRWRWRMAGAETLARHGIGGSAAAVAATAVPRNVPAPARNPKDPTSWGKVGRNEACPCGSGKKFKHCHGRYA